MLFSGEMAREVLKKADGDYHKVVRGEQLDDTYRYEDEEHTDMSFTN